MSTTEPAPGLQGAAARRRPTRGPGWPLPRGGIDGNEQLTALTGVTLIVLLAVAGVTILRIGQLISVHLFVGLLLIGPVVLKLASTGHRFMRYYTGKPAYVAKGPPWMPLRLIAPGVVLTTIGVFVSGLVLLFAGPAHRGAPLLLHKLSFILWLGFIGLHILGHLPGLGTSFRGAASLSDEAGIPGTGGRWLALTGALVGGLVLAIALVPHFSAWTAPGALAHHHHH